MYYLEYEPDTMAPFLRGLIRRFLASRISNSSISASPDVSHSYINTLDTMKKPNVEDSEEVKAARSQKYNLESIPGL